MLIIAFFVQSDIKFIEHCIANCQMFILNDMREDNGCQNHWIIRSSEVMDSAFRIWE